MDMKEKLVELLKKAKAKEQYDFLFGDIDTAIDMPYGAEYYADYLIANGVTVQEWISVKDRLPEDEGWYQVYTTPDRGQKSINKAMFHKGYEWDNFTPRWHGAGGHWANVSHWMPLPEPPKEV